MSLSRRSFALSALLLAAAAAFPVARAVGKGDYIVYIGTYTRQDSKGIYAWRFNADDGRLKPLGLVAETVNPSFLAIHPNNKYLYAVSEVSTTAGKPSGGVSAFSMDTATGKLNLLNTVSSHGAGPCYVSVDRTGKVLMVANYNSGSVASMPIKTDGSLGEAASAIQHTGSSVNPKRQEGPHAHSIQPSPDNRFALAADLGLDRLFVYKLDSVKATLTPNDPPFAKLESGAGPRHFAFDPSGKHVYVINEIKSTLTAFDYDKGAGSLKEIATVSTIPNEVPGNSTAEVLVHPNGKFVYGSNRGHNSIAVFAIDPRNGGVKLIDNAPTQGGVPRNFRIDPTGRWLFAANQDTNNVVLFRIDPATGRLTPASQSLTVTAPVCVKFVAAK
jgi:6-phosphogluconolactonase